MAVNFIGGGNRSTRRKPPTCHRSQTNLSQCCIEYTSPWTGFEFTTLVVIGTTAQVVNLTTMRSRPQRPLRKIKIQVKPKLYIFVVDRKTDGLLIMMLIKVQVCCNSIFQYMHEHFFFLSKTGEGNSIEKESTGIA